MCLRGSVDYEMRLHYLKLLWRLINRCNIHPSERFNNYFAILILSVSCLYERFFPRSCSLRIFSVRVLNKVVWDEGLDFLLETIVLTG